VGTVFYEQALFLDPPANALGLVSGISAKWIIGSGAGPRARRVAETHTNTMNPNGQNTASFGTSLRFD
jgi:hypothetical protein